MIRALLLSCVALVICWAVPSLAAAKCGTGNPLSYDDISAVRFQHDGCGVGRSTGPEQQLLCSSFWALFSNASAVDAGAKPVSEAIYSQYNLAASVGTYRLSATLADVRKVLRKESFFELSPVDVGPDTGEATLTVKRCAVVTKIRASLMPEAEGPTVRVLTDIMALIQDASKSRISASPMGFSYDIFFEK
jgi:hypothetical protein